MVNRSFKIRYRYILVCLIGWFPVLLAFFPGIYGYDAIGQMGEFFKHDFTTHHPLLHTLLFGSLYKLSDVSQNNAGRLAYSIIQMLILSGAIGYCLSYQKSKGVSSILIGVHLAWYAVLPLHSTMSIMTTKDIIFGALLLMVYVILCEIVEQPDEGIRQPLFVVIFLTLELLFRKNAVYAMILFAAYLLLFYRKKYRFVLRLIVLAVVLYTMLSGMLQLGCHAREDDGVEMWSVPLQQMAYVANEGNDEELTAEIGNVIPDTSVYRPYLADYVKIQVSDFDQTAWKTYMKCLWKHPVLCIRAFLDNIEGMWNLTDDPYGENVEFIIPETWKISAFGYVGFTGKDHNFLPLLRDKYIELFCYPGIYRYPVIRLLFRQSVYFWIFIGACICTRLFGEKIRNIPNVFLLFYILTLLMAPCAAMRYFYGVILCVPLAVIRAALEVGRRRERKENESILENQNAD